MTTQTITHKQGTTFAYSGLCKLPVGTWSARCKLARGPSIINTETVLTPLSAPDIDGNTHALSITMSPILTASVRPQVYDADIYFEDANNIVIATGSFAVEIIAGVSK